MIREPDLFSVLYLSNQARPVYPFIKHSLSGQSFQLSALIRLGDETFHARGEKVSLRDIHLIQIYGCSTMWSFLILNA